MKNRSKKDRFLSKFKTLDKFGYQVTLKYRSRSDFQTIFGAMMTLILSVGIFGYFLYLLKIVVNKDQFQVINSISKRDIAFDKYQVRLTKQNFDMGIYLYYNGDEKIQEDIDLYFQVNYQTAYYQQATTPEQIAEFGNIYQLLTINHTLEKCDQTRFGNNPRSAAQLGITDVYDCPKDDFQLILQGSFNANEARILQIYVDYCTPDYLQRKYPGANKTCKPKAEANKLITRVQLFTALMTSYFDQQDFEANPIKTIINNDAYQLLHPQISHNRVYKLSENYVTLADSWLSSFSDIKNLTYIDLRSANQYLSPVDLSQNLPLLTLQFVLDENVNNIQRQVMTIFDVFSQTGGLMGIAFAVFKFLIGWIQEFMFYSSIIKQLFYISEKHENSNVKSTGIKKTVQIQEFEDQKDESPIEQESQQRFQKADDQFNQSKILIDQTAQIDNSLVNEQTDLNPSSRSENIGDSKIELRTTNLILNYVKSLKRFKYNLKSYLKNKFSRLISKVTKKKNAKQRHEEILYNRGLQKIQRQFDIIQVFKQLRQIELLTQITLSKYQQYFLPILKGNILNFENSKNQLQQEISQSSQMDTQIEGNNNELMEINQDRQKLFIENLIIKSQNSKIDKRILKNLYTSKIFLKKTQIEAAQNTNQSFMRMFTNNQLRQSEPVVDLNNNPMAKAVQRNLQITFLKHLQALEEQQQENEQSKSLPDDQS